jgi:hypothetical protein
MRMNSDPSKRPWAHVAALAPAAALLAACTSPPTPSEETPRSATTTTTPSDVYAKLVYCNAKPGDEAPTAGPGVSAFEFVLGDSAAPGRTISQLVLTVTPPTPPDTDTGTHFSWEFSQGLTPPHPEEIRNTATLEIEGVTYAMGFTILNQATSQFVTFCAPEDTPNIPPSPTTASMLPPTQTA